MSISRRRRSFLKPEDLLDPDAEPRTPWTEKRRRPANLFDAVAGRVSYKYFRNAALSTSKNIEKLSGASQAVYPQEVLIRTSRCPLLSTDDPRYFANRRLSPERDADHQLPDSDMLKSIHAYVADFYARAITGGGGAIDIKSMDETALLAFGILLEEAAAHALGETGDMALVEGREEPEEEGLAKTEDQDSGSPLYDAEASVKQPASSQMYGFGKSRKRRKLGYGAALSRDGGGSEGDGG